MKKAGIAFMVLGLAVLVASIAQREFRKCVSAQPVENRRFQTEEIQAGENGVSSENASSARSQDSRDTSEPVKEEPTEPSSKATPESALTLQRREWMKAAHILTTRQLSYYHSLSDDDLEAKANGGDVLAKEVLGLKRAYAGDPEAAVMILEDAVVDGSVGSALALANLYTGVVTREFEPHKIEAYAWFNVARTMGEVSSAMTAASSKYHMTPEDSVLAQLYFASLLADLQQRSMERYGRQLPYNPEPVSE